MYAPIFRVAVQYGGLVAIAIVLEFRSLYLQSQMQLQNAIVNGDHNDDRRNH